MDATTRIHNLSRAIAELDEDTYPGIRRRIYQLLEYEVEKQEKKKAKRKARPAEPSAY